MDSMTVYNILSEVYNYCFIQRYNQYFFCIYIYNSILIWGLTILKSGARTPRTVTKFAVKTAIDMTQTI